MPVGIADTATPVGISDLGLFHILIGIANL